MNSLLACDLAELMNHKDFIPILAISLGCTVGMVAIVSGMVTGIVKSRALEATKREIAAYVAEGSIDPDHAVALLNAGRSACEIKGDSIKVT